MDHERTRLVINKHSSHSYKITNVQYMSEDKVTITATIRSAATECSSQRTQKSPFQHYPESVKSSSHLHKHQF